MSSQGICTSRNLNSSSVVDLPIVSLIAQRNREIEGNFEESGSSSPLLAVLRTSATDLHRENSSDSLNGSECGKTENDSDCASFKDARDVVSCRNSAN